LEVECLKVCVIGLGKLGLPLATVFADAGHEVTGIDVDPRVVEEVNSGKCPIVNEDGLPELLEKNVSRGRLKASTSYSPSNAFIITVPILLDKYKKPDLRIVEEVTKKIGECLRRGDLVVLESTAPPGTTDSLAVILEERSGLQGKDFHLAHSPERISSGRAIRDIINYPKIVGGINQESTKKAEELYRSICKEVILVRDARTAELVKIAEGLYRDVNIALANELALISKRHDIDVWEVIEAANTQPFCSLLKPGTGVGGHCIPVYPWFVIDGETKLIKAARELNDSMPSYVVEKVSRVLEEEGKEVKGSNILVAGLVFRPGVKETYHSPAGFVIEGLRKKGANVYGYDPLLEEKEMTALLGVGSPDGHRIDCAILMHDNLEVEAKKVIAPWNLFR
jgi:nucleotide sugar dehydrogenase